jgi:hypothetical protein
VFKVLKKCLQIRNNKRAAVVPAALVVAPVALTALVMLAALREASVNREDSESREASVAPVVRVDSVSVTPDANARTKTT